MYPNLIDWKSRKHTLVTTSTTEAELVAMSEAREDLEWKLALEMTNRSGKPFKMKPPRRTTFE